MLALYIVGGVILYIAIGLILVHLQIKRGWVSDATDFWALVVLWLPWGFGSTLTLIVKSLVKAPKAFAHWYINKVV